MALFLLQSIITLMLLQFVNTIQTRRLYPMNEMVEIIIPIVATLVMAFFFLLLIWVGFRLARVLKPHPKSLKECKIYSTDDARFMRMAIHIAEENVDRGGGPFGAVIVRNGEVISTGANRVVPTCDPTAHAEVSAIREACQKLGTFKLEGCTVYSSCEPCPMCLSALYWAGVERICYGNTKDDAKAINFDDSFIYDELELDYNKRSIRCEHFLRDEALGSFRKWAEKEDKVEY